MLEMYETDKEPDIPVALGLLSHLNNGELKELLDDDGKFEDIVKDIKEFKEFEKEKELLMASNRSLAEFNLSKQPDLEAGKKALADLSEKGNQLCSDVKEKLNESNAKSGAMSVETALDLLQAAAAEIEEESEEVAAKFLAGDMEVDEFLDMFLSRRKLMHLRKVKVDKMRELLTKSSSASSGYAATCNNYPGSGPLPYPTGHVLMPMPRYGLF